MAADPAVGVLFAAGILLIGASAMCRLTLPMFCAMPLTVGILFDATFLILRAP